MGVSFLGDMEHLVRLVLRSSCLVNLDLCASQYLVSDESALLLADALSKGIGNDTHAQRGRGRAFVSVFSFGYSLLFFSHFLFQPTWFISESSALHVRVFSLFSFFTYQVPLTLTDLAIGAKGFTTLLNAIEKIPNLRGIIFGGACTQQIRRSTFSYS